MLNDDAQLANLLVLNGMLDAERLRDLMTIAESAEAPLYVTIIQEGAVQEEDLVGLVSLAIGVPSVLLKDFEKDPVLSEMLPADLVHNLGALPVGMDADEHGNELLYVAMADPTNEEALRQITDGSPVRIVPVLAGPIDLLNAIERCVPFPTIKTKSPLPPPPPPPRASARESRRADSDLLAAVLDEVDKDESDGQDASPAPEPRDAIAQNQKLPFDLDIDEIAPDATVLPGANQPVRSSPPMGAPAGAFGPALDMLQDDGDLMELGGDLDLINDQDLGSDDEIILTDAEPLALIEEPISMEPIEPVRNHQPPRDRDVPLAKEDSMLNLDMLANQLGESDFRGDSQLLGQVEPGMLMPADPADDDIIEAAEIIEADEVLEGMEILEGAEFNELEEAPELEMNEDAAQNPHAGIGGEVPSAAPADAPDRVHAPPPVADDDDDLFVRPVGSANQMASALAMLDDIPADRHDQDTSPSGLHQVPHELESPRPASSFQRVQSPQEPYEPTIDLRKIPSALLTRAAITILLQKGVITEDELNQELDRARR